MLKYWCFQHHDMLLFLSFKNSSLSYVYYTPKNLLILLGYSWKNINKELKTNNFADIVVHHAIPQHAGRYAKFLHVTPKRIGEVAKAINVKHFVLSHRMKRTYDSEAKSLWLIKENFSGDIIWAEDLMNITVK